MTLNDVMNAAEVIRAAQATANVALLTDEGEVIYGTARRITGNTEDVWETSLEVTTKQGWEASWSMSMLIDKVGTGEFVVNP